MTRSVPGARRALVVAVLGAASLMLMPAVAEAAKISIKGNSVSVTDNGVAAVKLKNPNATRAKGRLTLKSNGKAIGSRRFAIPARRTRKVKVELGVGAFQTLEQSGELKVAVVVRAAGRGTSRKSIELDLAGGGSGTEGGSGGPPSPGGGSAGPAWADGRWQGTYAENSTDLAFNIVGTRLYTGPFDAFYIDANCYSAALDEHYTDATAIEPVEAAIGGDGSFSGSGTYRPGYGLELAWTLSGRVAGQTLTGGTFSVSYTDTRGNPCSGTTHFTAGWYGDYIG